jgi:hypothetical protein
MFRAILSVVCGAYYQSSSSSSMTSKFGNWFQRNEPVPKPMTGIVCPSLSLILGTVNGVVGVLTILLLVREEGGGSSVCMAERLVQ